MKFSFDLKNMKLTTVELYIIVGVFFILNLGVNIYTFRTIRAVGRDYDTMSVLYKDLRFNLDSAQSNLSDSVLNDKRKNPESAIYSYINKAMEQADELRVIQPKINLKTGAPAGAEALCRWFRDGQFIMPADFIPTLEMSTEICKLDFYMLDRVCRDIRRWLDEGRQVVRISVNLSRRHIMDYDLLQNIIEIIDRHSVPHQFIEIELTETTTDVEFRALKRLVSGLQAAGIYTSVDDFGMGYSSLNLIREIPWNVLKIDRSFLPDNQDEPDSTRSVMFRHVIAMAQALGLVCIAEGVETQSQVEILQESSCVLAQGFFFDRPLPTADFERRLQDYRYSVG